jgi:hypothetical protein
MFHCVLNSEPNEVLIVNLHLCVVLNLVLDKCLGSALRSGHFVFWGNFHRTPDVIKNLYGCHEEESSHPARKDNHTVYIGQ